MRNILRVVLVLGFAFLILSVKRPLAAAGVVGNGTPGSCTESALDNALFGGGIVTFNCGANPVTISVTSQKTINDDLTVDGGGLVTLSGGNSTRIFNIQNNNNTNGVDVVLRNLTVANGRSSQNGGGAYVERLSSLTVENSTFTNNVGLNGGAIATNGWGADDTGAVVNISDSTFTNNSATAAAIPGGGNGGGGLYIAGASTATVTDSTFTGNHSQNGGAIHILLSDVTATNVTFTSNTANNSAGGGGGGAIYMDGTKSRAGDLQISDSRFYNNSTNQFGGAIFSYIQKTGITQITNAVFDGNVSSNVGSGGAIYHQSQEGTGPMTIERSLFVRNKAVGGTSEASGQGGALWLENARVNITNSTFTQNEAGHSLNLAPDNWKRGVAGAVRTSTDTYISNSTIVDNHAGFVGGALAGDANVENTIIANNSGDNPWDIQQNCTVVINDLGGNIQYPQKTTSLGNDFECFTDQNTTQDPKLMPLGDYGGPTQTMALMVDSPAIGSAVNGGCPGNDQRGFLRSDGQCDVGAYELYAAAAPVLIRMDPVWAGVNESGSDKTIAVSGADFRADNEVHWDGTPLTTTYVDPFRLTAVIPAANISTTGTAAITVFDPGPDTRSDALTFTIVEELNWVYLPVVLR